MMDKNDLYRLFTRYHVPSTPPEMIDGTGSDVEIMGEFAKMMHKVAGAVLINCPPNPERDIAIRHLYDALIYADLSLLLGDYAGN